MLRVAARLAYRQLTHRGAKLAGALSGVCVAITLMFIQVGFENALYDSAASMPTALNADIVITSAKYQSMEYSPPWFPRGLLTEVEGVVGVASTVPLYAQIIQVTSPRNGENLACWLLAAPPHGNAFSKLDIASYAQVLDRPSAVIMDDQSRHEYQRLAQRVKDVGSETVAMSFSSVTLQQTVDILGLFSLGPTFTVDGMLITSDLNYYRITFAPLDRISLGLVRLNPGFSAKKVRGALQESLGERAKVFTKEEFVQSERNYYATATPIGYIFRAGLFVGVVVGLVFIFQALHGIISDNIKEYAVLRAMGYRNVFFVIQIGIMSLGITLITYIPSVLFSVFFYRIASSATSLPLAMKITDMLIFLGVVTGMGLVATAMASRKLQYANPVDLFG